MLFGMPTLIETKNLEECVKQCKKLGLDFIEINMNLPEYQIDTLDVNQLNYYQKEYKIFFTIHLEEKLNIADFNPLVAEAYTKTVLKTIEIAKKIGCPIVNMHMSQGVYFTLPDKKIYLFEQYKDKYLESLATFTKKCEEAIGNAPIKIAIENTVGYQPFIKQGIKQLLTSPCFALTYDVGHDFTINHQDLPFILENANRLVHMHLHDAQEKKNHLPLGTGRVPISERLWLAREYKCRVVLETKTIAGLEETVKWLQGIQFIENKNI